MKLYKAPAVLLAVVFLPGCAARKSHVKVASLIRTYPDDVGPEPPPPALPLRPEVRQQSQQPEPQRVVSAPSTPEPLPEPEPAPPKRRHALSRPTIAEHRAVVRAAKYEPEDTPAENGEHAPSVLLWLLAPIAVVLLWIAGRAAIERL